MKSYIYPYSKSSILYMITIPCVVIAGSIPSLLKFIIAEDSTNWVLILLFDFCFLLLLLYAIIKWLTPALQGKIALEINSTGIISYAKDVTIEWKDIKNIEQISGKTFSALKVNFKYSTDRGNSIRIPLGYVAGKDDEIYDTAISFLEKD